MSKKIILEKNYKKYRSIKGLNESLDKMNELLAKKFKKPIVYNGVKFKTYRMRNFCSCGYIGDGSLSEIIACKNCGNKLFYNLSASNKKKVYHTLLENNILYIKESFLTYNSDDEKELVVYLKNNTVYEFDFSLNYLDFKERLKDLDNGLWNTSYAKDIIKEVLNMDIIKEIQEELKSKEEILTLFDAKKYKFAHHGLLKKILAFYLELIYLHQKNISLNDKDLIFFSLVLSKDNQIDLTNYNEQTFIDNVDLNQELACSYVTFIRKRLYNTFKKNNVSDILYESDLSRIDYDIDQINNLIKDVSDKETVTEILKYILDNNLNIYFTSREMTLIEQIEDDGLLEHFKYFIKNNDLKYSMNYIIDDFFNIYYNLIDDPLYKVNHNIMDNMSYEEKNKLLEPSHFDRRVINLKNIKNILSSNYDDGRINAFILTLEKNPLFAYTLLNKKGKLDDNELKYINRYLNLEEEITDDE